jgi:hypothetical protein
MTHSFYNILNVSQFSEETAEQVISRKLPKRDAAYVKFTRVVNLSAGTAIVEYSK